MIVRMLQDTRSVTKMPFVWLSTLLILSASGCGESDSSNTPVIAARNVANQALEIQVAELGSQYGRAFKGDYAGVETVVGKKPFRVAILATWCPYSIEFLDRAARHDPLASEYVMAVYENEYELALKKAVREGEITASEADEHRMSPENQSRMVIDPDALLSFGLPIYVIPPGTLEDHIEGYPSRVRCDSQGCESTTTSVEEARMMLRDDLEFKASIMSNLPAALREEYASDPDRGETELARLIAQLAAESDD